MAADPDGELDRDLRSLLAPGVVTGTEPLGTVLTRLGRSFAADGSFDLAAVLLEFDLLGDADAVTSIRAGYEATISPSAEGSLSGQR